MLIRQLRKLSITAFVALSVLSSEFLTSLMSLVLQGKVTFDYLVTGGVVSLIVSAVIVYLIRHVAALTEYNESLQREIDIRKEVEEELKVSKERFREMTDSLPLTVFEFNEKGIYTFVNRTGYATFGYKPEDLEKNFSVAHTLAPEDLPRALRNMHARMQGVAMDPQEYTVMGRDGTTFPAVAHMSQIVVDGKVVGLRGILVDSTDQKRFEAERLKAQKLESLGVLAGGIAHDFNNILTAILGNISLVRMKLGKDDHLVRKLMEAEKASIRAKGLTQQLLTFAKGGAPRKGVIAPGHLIRETSQFAVLGTNVRIDFSLPGDLWPIDVDSGQIEQVFHNLVLNACQAMPVGGMITVCAENITAPPDNTFPLKEGRYVKVTVSDQGQGIPAEYLDNIFDPYFTTKQGGNGLGLAVVYSIVRNHGGHIEVDSVEGEGATFSLYFPAAPEGAQEETSETALIRGKGNILIMDDEAMVREVAGAILNEVGYDVSYARDGEEAVALYRQRRESGRRFDAVIMDLTVPGGMGGKEAITRLLALDPQAKAIVSSGYSGDQIMSNYRQFGFAGVVGKPYKPEELSQEVHRVVNGPES